MNGHHQSGPGPPGPYGHQNNYYQNNGYQQHHQCHNSVNHHNVNQNQMNQNPMAVHHHQQQYSTNQQIQDQNQAHAMALAQQQLEYQRQQQIKEQQFQQQQLQAQQQQQIQQQQQAQAQAAAMQQQQAQAQQQYQRNSYNVGVSDVNAMQGIVPQQQSRRTSANNRNPTQSNGPSANYQNQSSYNNNMQQQANLKQQQMAALQAKQQQMAQLQQQQQQQQQISTASTSHTQSGNNQNQNQSQQQQLQQQQSQNQQGQQQQVQQASSSSSAADARRKEKAEAIQNQEYIDPLACVPRTQISVISKVAKIVARFVQDNDRMQNLALQMEQSPNSVANTLPNVLSEAKARIAIHRRQVCHPHAAHFHVLITANLTIEDYFKRLQRYFHCSPECFILAFIYVDRAVTMNRDSLLLGTSNIHRLVLAALTLAVKFWDDVYYSNYHYARVGGVSTQELDNLEYQLLCLVNWRLYVDPVEYKGYLRMIEESPLSVEDEVAQGGGGVGK